MKKLIMLLAVTFSFAIVNAQETSTKKAKTEMKKSCSKDCTKSCCADKSNTKKSCASSKKSCSKTCTGSSATAYSKRVSAKEFVAYANRFPAEQIIDIRTIEEVKATGMIDGATNIDYRGRDYKEKMNQLDKNVALMIYCNSGKRSSEAIAMLKSWGFKKIYELDGGYQAYLVDFPAK